MRTWLALSLLVLSATAGAQGVGRGSSAGGTWLLPSESRGLPTLQRVGRFHAGVFQCRLVPAREAGAWRANAQQQERAHPHFDREYDLGFQGGHVAWEHMGTIARVSYCRQINDTWLAISQAAEE